MYVRINAPVPVDLELFKKTRKQKGIEQSTINKALGKSTAYTSRLEAGHFKTIPIESVEIIQRVMGLTKEERKRIFGV